MKNLKSRKALYAVLAIAGLFLSILPILLGDNAELTKYSIVPFIFAVCSVIYAVIAFIFMDKGNLFVAGRRHWFYRVLDWTFSGESRDEDEEYKREFELSAFLFCITIPAYVTFAFFATGFYSALGQALGWTIIRELAIIIIVIVPPIIKRIKARQQQQMQDEADRKTQEHRESMGNWK